MVNLPYLLLTASSYLLFLQQTPVQCVSEHTSSPQRMLLCNKILLSLSHREVVSSNLLSKLLLKLIVVGELRTRLLRHLGDSQVVGVGVEC